ncbi:MAG: Uma2 family endonuclease [Elainella sp. Prado103]|jgi:Uma2 family endonuclease|nr:Uma2 family endonuclease [Elainella sp. Prado103]
MVAIGTQKLTLADYLADDDGSEQPHELVDGQRVPMPPESDINQRIASLLFAFFLQQGIPFYRLRIGTEIVVLGSSATARLPDLLVLSEELALALEGASRSTVMMEMPPPLLVVEVVSPGQENRDYRYKRSEYAARGIAEYWIVDPMQQCLTLLEWVDGLYEEQCYTGDRPIVSPQLGELTISAAQILAGR